MLAFVLEAFLIKNSLNQPKPSFHTIWGSFTFASNLTIYFDRWKLKEQN